MCGLLRPIPNLLGPSQAIMEGSSKEGQKRVSNRPGKAEPVSADMH